MMECGSVCGVCRRSVKKVTIVHVVLPIGLGV